MGRDNGGQACSRHESLETAVVGPPPCGPILVCGIVTICPVPVVRAHSADAGACRGMAQSDEARHERRKQRERNPIMAKLPSNEKQLEMLSKVDPRDVLSGRAKAHFEALAFMELRPDYYSSPENGKRIGEFLQEHKLPTDVESYDRAYKALKAAKKLEEPPIMEGPDPKDIMRATSGFRQRLPYPTHPEDFERKVTKAEFYTKFGSDRAEDFMNHYGDDWVNQLHD
jgi:hypothetical protein